MASAATTPRSCSRRGIDLVPRLALAAAHPTFATEDRIDVVRRAEQVLGLSFHQRRLLEQAFVHRSYLNENPTFPLPSNERLEYLGDAIIEFVVSDSLYRRYPSATEGILTAMRAALVRTSTLGRFGRALGLGTLLYLGRGEEEESGRARPRLLAQTFEAVVGAIYLDLGLDVTRTFLGRFLDPEIDRLGGERFLLDAKSRLQELAQALTGLTPVYRTVSTTGSGHRPHFVVEVCLGERVLARGEGDRKQEAEQEAARIALDAWPPSPAR